MGNEVRVCSHVLDGVDLALPDPVLALLDRGQPDAALLVGQVDVGKDAAGVPLKM